MVVGLILLFCSRSSLSFGSFLFDLIVNCELGSHTNQINEIQGSEKEQDQTGRVEGTLVQETTVQHPSHLLSLYDLLSQWMGTSLARRLYTSRAAAGSFANRPNKNPKMLCLR